MNYLEYKQWGANNCTVRDFSIEMVIERKMWENFKEKQKVDPNL